MDIKLKKQKKNCIGDYLKSMNWTKKIGLIVSCVFFSYAYYFLINNSVWEILPEW